ncbi:MAG: hypothetical protein JKX95_03090 [Bacteroidia bacterium]|nr:hypothetical protein [Bacteroidia bacterium]
MEIKYEWIFRKRMIDNTEQEITKASKTELFSYLNFTRCSPAGNIAEINKQFDVKCSTGISSIRTCHPV